MERRFIDVERAVNQGRYERSRSYKIRSSVDSCRNQGASLGDEMFSLDFAGFAGALV